MGSFAHVAEILNANDLKTFESFAEDPEFLAALSASPQPTMARVRHHFDSLDYLRLIGAAESVSAWAIAKTIDLAHRDDERFRGHVGEPDIGLGQLSVENAPGSNSGVSTQPTATVARVPRPRLGETPSGPVTIALARSPTAGMMEFERTVNLSMDTPTVTFRGTELGLANKRPLPYNHNGDPLVAIFDASATTAMGNMNLAPEAQIYARDPEDIASFLATLPVDSAAIKEQLVPSDIGFGPFRSTEIANPAALSLFSPVGPSVVHGYGPYAPTLINLENSRATAPLTGELFYGDPHTFTPGPLGQQQQSHIPTVEAIRLQVPGLCTLGLQFDNFFGGSGAQVNIDDLLSQGVPCDSITTAVVKELIVAPMSRTNAWDPFSVAQIFLHLNAFVSALNLFCNIQASVIYDLGIDSRGVLQVFVDPANIRISNDEGGGTGCADIDFPVYPPIWGVNSRVQYALEYLIPYAINWQLAFVQSGGQGGLRTLPTESCDTNDVATCAVARFQLCNLVRAGFRTAGYQSLARDDSGCISNFGDQQMSAILASVDDAFLNRLLAAINNDELWSCQSNCQGLRQDGLGVGGLGPSPNSFLMGDCAAGSCIFRPPVKRLLLNHDSIGVVLYDRESFDDAAFAVKFAGLALGQNICSYKRPDALAGSVWREPFIFQRDRVCLCPSGAVRNTYAAVDDPQREPSWGSYCICKQALDTGYVAWGADWNSPAAGQCNGVCYETIPDVFEDDAKNCGSCGNVCKCDDGTLVPVCFSRKCYCTAPPPDFGKSHFVDETPDPRVSAPEPPHFLHSQ